MSHFQRLLSSIFNIWQKNCQQGCVRFLFVVNNHLFLHSVFTFWVLGFMQTCGPQWNADCCWTWAQDFVVNHLTPAAILLQLTESHSNRTTLVLICAICTVINPHAPVHTFLPNEQAEVDTTSSNSSPQHRPHTPQIKFCPWLFFWGWGGSCVREGRLVASTSQVISPVLT